MSRHKRCLNFQWRDEDPAWRAERDNDRIVFRKIRKMTIGGLSADRVIAALFRSDFWLERMRGKTRASWKRCYYRWRAKCTSSPPVLVTVCKRKNRRPTPANTARNANAKSFIVNRFYLTLRRRQRCLRRKGKLSTCKKRKRGK